MASLFFDRKLLLLITTIVVIIIQCSDGLATANPQVTAMWVFGDSLVDNGNNNHLTSLAKANFYPYGIDYNSGSTGRFSNGKNVIDFLAKLLGVQSPPAFADPSTSGAKMIGGVNYASAAGGILDETGLHYGNRYPLTQQITNFEATLSQLRGIMTAEANFTLYLSKSIAIVVIGSNDYINNYLLPTLYSSSYNYTPSQYAKFLLNRYKRQLAALYRVGLRKFFLAGIGPLGCIPSQLATGQALPGKCVDYVNQILGPFNEGLKRLVDIMNNGSQFPGALFVFGNTYGGIVDILNNSAKYGFTVWDRGCCGLGRNKGQITCLPFVAPCLNRNQYIFWDAFHPTQACDAILAKRSYSGTPSDCHPMNIRQLVKTRN